MHDWQRDLNDNPLSCVSLKDTRACGTMKSIISPHKHLFWKMSMLFTADEVDKICGLSNRLSNIFAFHFIILNFLQMNHWWQLNTNGAYMVFNQNEWNKRKKQGHLKCTEKKKFSHYSRKLILLINSTLLFCSHFFYKLMDCFGFFLLYLHLTFNDHFAYIIKSM